MERSVPRYDDARLILKLYELRRDEKMRAARDWFGTKFLPATIEDVKAVSGSTGPENAYYRMVTSYWDMAASFVARGILNIDLFLDSGGEMLFVWSRVAHLGSGPRRRSRRRDREPRPGSSRRGAPSSPRTARP